MTATHGAERTGEPLMAAPTAEMQKGIPQANVFVRSMDTAEAGSGEGGRTNGG